ncbi:MAG: hypothetical protein LBC48_03295 [Dysgonamonadaceae bacterium]|jgi:hypothetical protein|nr:hypothetical protein [Dysgonamonadaceae bacterium]
MKKLILIASLMTLFYACTEEYHPRVYSSLFTVYSDPHKLYHWQPFYDKNTGALLYYYCEFPEPKLTLDIIESRSTEAYLYYPLESSNGTSVYTPLPFSDFIVDKDGYKWEEQMTVAYDPGYITFILKVDDHANVLPSFDRYDFLVKFSW